MFEKRQVPILIFISAIGLIYIIRLFNIQVLNNKYNKLGTTNAVKIEVQIPARGQIYDRNKRLLVTNVEVYDMYVTPKNIKNLDTTKFINLFGITKQFFDSTLNIAKEYSNNRASIMIRQLSKEDYARVADAMINFTGFTFEQSFYRSYPESTLSNALGFIAEIPKKLYEKQEGGYYRKGDFIGLDGLEKVYEKELRGQRGIAYKMMNVQGEDKGSYENGRFDTLAISGKNLTTTIDVEIQKLADTLFRGKVGGIIAIEPSTGEILALGSYPTYDPNDLSGKLYSQNFSKLLNNPDKPLFNRVIQSQYRPGSTFKLVQSAIGLQQGVISTNSSFYGTTAPVKCHGHNSAHLANLNNAIAFSCNPYFYQVFRRIINNTTEKNPFIAGRIGLEKWDEMVEKMGFGKRLGIDIPSERIGYLPNSKLYDKFYGKNRWKFSNIYSLSIGEGELDVNILKLANLACVFANKGYYITPHLLKYIDGSDKDVPKELLEKHESGISPKNFSAIYNGLSRVVKPGGTARRAGMEEIEILGKTGTSQNKRGRDHAIFIAFAPKENPKIAIGVVVENAGFGGAAAAPIASLIIEKYLTGQIKRQELKNATIAQNFRTVGH